MATEPHPRDVDDYAEALIRVLDTKQAQKRQEDLENKDTTKVKNWQQGLKGTMDDIEVLHSCTKRVQP